MTNNQEFAIDELLALPSLMASVATVIGSGRPALSSMWFAFAERRFWFTTRDARNPFVDGACAGKPVAVMVSVFEPPKRIGLIRATGPARIEPPDRERVRAVYERYLGADLALWPEFFRERLDDSSFVLWSVHAVSGKAETFPELVEGIEYSWREPQSSIDGLSAVASES